MQGENKACLRLLYNEIEDDDPPLIFNYEMLKFSFAGTSYRTPQRLIMYVHIPAELLGGGGESITARETCILKFLEPVISELSEEYSNVKKEARGQTAHFEIQSAGEIIARRNGIRYIADEDKFLLRLKFKVPLINEPAVNAKVALRAVKEVLFRINEALLRFEQAELEKYLETELRQREIRKYMSEHGLSAFIANGSILPRENGTEKPMSGAVPFVSCPELSVGIPISTGEVIAGMGIPLGITVVTGGGYSGKSTLLDALEMGIYNHIPGDGRELVLSDISALKANAEDGRPVSGLDISPFFKKLSGGTLSNFATSHASGSVSQAANIIEAAAGGVKLLLLDEDKCATNFMMRDFYMRSIVKNETIIPLTDRIKELYKSAGMSTILVIGGTSEYLSYADHVILMEDYLPKEITDEVKKLPLRPINKEEETAHFESSRRLLPRGTNQPLLYVQKVETENEKRIIIDEYTSDITHLTAIISSNQLNTLAYAAEQLLCIADAAEYELIELSEKCINAAFGDDEMSALPENSGSFYEEIRPIEIYSCLNRMRGLRFVSVQNKK